jgi:hypothetical protein
MVRPLRLGNTAFSRDSSASEPPRPGVYEPPPLTFDEALDDQGPDGGPDGVIWLLGALLALSFAAGFIAPGWL